jgi:hypothetical protein
MGDQGFLTLLEEGVLAPELQAVRNQEVRWVHQPIRVAPGVPTFHRSHLMRIGT